MPLSTGTRLGPYEILSAIGAGGMGEVYRAKDTRLDRIVAIKVLPTHLSSNPQFKQRFEREARAISSITHPNICALYDIGQQNGAEYLVMEYLEGEALAKRLERGSLPADQVLKYGIQVAEALDRAHKQGIVHRDLKPGNIMITKSGAKLLDFGLAKYEMKSQSSQESVLETRDEPLTEEGTILGTVQYMSPEQIEGKESDARTDIFALGEVLYEMSTGQRTFKGNSKAQLMASIMTADPQPISAVQPLAPPALDHVIKKCLAKDPEERWQNARDVASELRWISEQTSQPKVAGASLRRQKKLWPITANALLFLLAGLSVFLFFTREPKKYEVLKLSIMPPANTKITGQLALAPDGKKIVYVAKTIEGETALWLRYFNSLDSKRLPGTQDATMPFWSPDSRFVGFFAEGKLKKIDTVEGPPQVLATAAAGRLGSWNKDGVIVYAPNFSATPLHRISASGGTATPLKIATATKNQNFPAFLPDQKHFIFRTGSPDRSIWVAQIDSQEAKKLLASDSRSEYAPPGYLLYVRAKTLMAQPFDLKKYQLKGDPVAVADDIGFDGTYHSFSVSQTNVLAYSTVDTLNTQLVWMDRSGRQIAPLTDRGSYIEPYFSPDEKKVTHGHTDPGDTRVNVWILDLERGTSSRFGFTDSNQYGSIWSPDGKTIVYAAVHDGVFNLFEKPANGAAPERVLVPSKVSNFSDDWSPDGRYIIYEYEDPKTKYDLWAVPMFGERKPFPYVQSDFNDAHAKFSPDGKWVAYGSDEIGRTEIYVRRFPDAAAGKWQVSTGGGDQPYWRADGKELFYLGPDGTLMAADVQLSESFNAGVPKKLFQTYVVPQGLIGSDRNQYLASADGRRFLVNTSPSQSIFSAITVIFNWTQLLKK